LELAKREKQRFWLRPSEAEPELTKSREASIVFGNFAPQFPYIR
jgi:hypothetical protein